MNVYALQQQFRKIKRKAARPAVVATLQSGPVEISPADLLDYFIAAIRLGDAPKDDKLFPILKNALPDPDQGLIFGCLRKLAQGIEPSIEDGDLFLPREKQAKSILESTQRINLWYGSVRSSKTIMSLIKWLWRCLRGPKGRRMMVGNTSETLELNCIDPMRELLPAAVSFTTGWRHCIIFGRKVVLRGANDVGQEKKFRGPTLVDVYGDEITTWAKTIFKMILTRLSRPDAACFLTTNPDQPLHYLNTDYIERVKELSMTIWHFVLGDNPGLPEEYKADLIRENPPGTVYYYRFILGLWVAAEGLIYKTFDKIKHVVSELPKNFSQIVMGVDYGSTNPTVFLMLGMTENGKWIVFKEYYYKDQQKVDTDFSHDMKEFIGEFHPTAIEVDPSAASFRKQLRRDGIGRIHEADNSVLDGIRNVAAAITAGKLLIHDSCKNIIAEIQGYSWDENAKDRGLEVPIKINDHAMDALRYACRRIFARGIV